MSQNQIPPSIECPSPVLAPGAQGIDRVAVDDAKAQLIVTFLTPILPRQSYLFDRASYSLTGGKRLFPRILKASSFPPTSPPSSPPGAGVQSVALTLDTLGDFSIYTLTVSGPDVDPFFSSAKLRFRLACDDFFDCRPLVLPPAQQPELPVTIDYLAKDYAGFRQALLDFIPTRLPAWTERSEADIGMMLLELFSATADNLSYTQDRVANEAFLGTATQRRSVAGHLALIGYQIDEGASAHTWLQFQVNQQQTLPVNPGFKVSNNPNTSDDPVIVFETMGSATLDPLLNRISLYDWGNRNCCLPKQALNAALVGRFDRVLTIGDYLLFDDGKGQRDVVRLTARPQVLPLSQISSPPIASPPGSPPSGFVTIVAWSAATPLRHDYCVANTVVRGNLALATHGETVPRPETLRLVSDAQKAQISAGFSSPSPMRLRLKLAQAPLVHIDPQVQALGLPPQPSTVHPATPAASFTERAARSISSLELKVENDPWKQKASLLGSRPDEKVFRVEIDDSGEATVVFGDGKFGQPPPATAGITAIYRVGGGASGNLGSDTLVKARPNGNADWLISVTNPLPATGGRDLESRDHARRFGPSNFHQPLVAVSAADYQNAAASFVNPDGSNAIQRANAAFRWTGSWLTVTLTVDPLGSGQLTSGLRQRLIDYLDSKRLAGYDLEVSPPVDLPVDLAIQFVAAAGSNLGDVQQALLQALSNGDLPDGSKGFFHPDNFTFGQNLYISKIFEAVTAVPGVRSAKITRLAQSHAAQPDKETSVNLARGFLAVGADQVIRLDNDRNFPQNGTLTLLPQGVQA
ncbi:MAG TPA: baseplate J/gp47 family protein [Candidatus Angelobacter sp.]|nr:baseplate J/gp47 family protein [Candidatus Angelobacter sp.]